jgi:hypothetical protein
MPGRPLCEGQPAGTIMDNIACVNIMPFGLCRSWANPSVILATAAKLGVFTPMPCLPAITGPWFTGAPNVLINGQPALDNASHCLCLWTGLISVVNPGQVEVSIP